MTIKIDIEQEHSKDHSLVEDLVARAFKTATHTNGKEWLLVQKLRHSPHFLPELSLIAKLEDKIIGHILFTKIAIQSSQGDQFESLALAPVSVDPEFQNQGVGAKLILRGHEIAKNLGFKSVIVLGHPHYYPKFGYQKASTWNIQAPFKVPDEVFMAIELASGSLTDTSGTVIYPKEFLEE